MKLGRLAMTGGSSGVVALTSGSISSSWELARWMSRGATGESSPRWPETLIAGVGGRGLSWVSVSTNELAREGVREELAREGRSWQAWVEILIFTAFLCRQLRDKDGIRVPKRWVNPASEKSSPRRLLAEGLGPKSDSEG